MSARRYARALAPLLLAAAGCSLSHGPSNAYDEALPPVGASESVTVTAMGATLEREGMTITVPAGATKDGTKITVTVAEPHSFGNVIPISGTFVFEPDGLHFDTPIEVRIPYIGDADGATLYWTELGTTDHFEPIPLD